MPQMRLHCSVTDFFVIAEMNEESGRNVLRVEFPGHELVHDFFFGRRDAVGA
jgi:hypothetical protein